MTAIKTEPVDISVENGEKFIVDKKLIADLIKFTKKGSFSETKERLISVVSNSTEKDELIENVDDFMFKYKVVNHPNFPRDEK